MKLNKLTVSTTNTYEAAFYLMHGAIFESVTSRCLPEKKRLKKGFTYVWTIKMRDIPQRAVEIYRNGSAQANIDQYETARKKLKVLIRKNLFKVDHFKAS